MHFVVSNRIDEVCNLNSSIIRKAKNSLTEERILWSLQVPNSHLNVLLIFRAHIISLFLVDFLMLIIGQSPTAKIFSVQALLNFLLYPVVNFPPMILISLLPFSLPNLLEIGNNIQTINPCRACLLKKAKSLNTRATLIPTKGQATKPLGLPYLLRQTNYREDAVFSVASF